MLRIIFNQTMKERWGWTKSTIVASAMPFLNRKEMMVMNFLVDSSLFTTVINNDRNSFLPSSFIEGMFLNVYKA